MTGPSPILLPRPRLAALDAFRGFTMLAMVVVNNPGSWSHVYAPLKHAAWNGLTPTDLIFPFFLFIVGVSLHISTGHAIHAAQPLPWTKFLRRSALLIALGIFLNAFPFFPGFDPAQWRLTGVLQRIGLCFILACAIIDLARRLNAPLSTAVLAILVAYGLIVGSPLHDFDAIILRNTDLRFLPKGHFYKGSLIDPEGLLSTIPATASVLLGYLAARVALPLGSPIQFTNVFRLLGLSLVLTTCGGLLHASHSNPINKIIWSPAFALITAGLAGVSLAALLLLECPANSPSARAAAMILHPFSIAGRNAILLFVASGMLARILNLIVWNTPQGLLAPFREHAFTALSSIGPAANNPELASLTYALFVLAFWWAVLWWLDRRSIHLKL